MPSSTESRLIEKPVFQAVFVYVLALIASILAAPLADTQWVQLRSVAVQVVLGLALPIVVTRALKLEFRSVFKIRSTSTRNLLLIPPLTLCLIVLLDEVNYLIIHHSAGGAAVNSTITQFLQTDSPIRLLQLCVSMALVPAFCEEFLFRGFLLDRLLAKGFPATAVMLSAFLFAFFHQNFYLLLPGTMAGVLLGFIVLRSGSILTVIACHFLVNVSGILAVNSQILVWLPWTGGDHHVPLWLLILSLVGICVCGKGLESAREEPIKSNGH